jgi:hypothetical protein
MKKIFTIITAAVVLQACSNTTSTSSDLSKTETATDTMITQTKTSKEEPKSEVWALVNVVDEFGDTVKGKKSYVATFKGKMTNSAVADADLSVVYQLQDSTMACSFFEYDRQPKAQLPKSKFIKVKIKTAEGEVKEIEQFFYDNMMFDDDKKMLKFLLSQKAPVKMIVDLKRVDKYENTAYTFEVDPTGIDKTLVKNL